MNIRVTILVLIRLLLFIVSAATLACHIAQVVLLGTSDWWPGYKVYVLYYVGAGFSLICSVALLVVSCMSNIRSIRGDRIVSVVCIALLIAVIVYNTIEAGVVPWLPSDIASDAQQNFPSTKGFATYCSDYSIANNSDLTSKTTNRCWLQNGSWLGIIIAAALWIVLALYTYLQKKSTVYNEHDAHDYIEDAPMAIDHGSTPSPAAYAVADLHQQQPQYSNIAPAAGGSSGVQYDNSAPYPNYYNYYDTNAVQQPYAVPPQRQMSYSTDYSGSGVPLYNTGGGSNPGYTFPYGEKVAVASTPSERSASEPPHSHDGARV
ncbi:hypothetical protein BDB00DRAFT_938098 [Zychaea mexicana]|uniref:uncharacterized protein n=1 Tax=Zychaea mexicana TaxID=64656 RepID=UPI0022FDF5BD|nr:uncharacterized protein BDB00DRAFT_938098 [Zychaea mexicana]KAI9494796.1 hypothetical protein BDB00DRAFT_938098 [Zychaea mexicana]